MNNDHRILRELASRIAEIASLPVQAENARLYRALNALKPIRPVVLIDELPWNQLNGDGELDLACNDPFLQSTEREMKRLLYKWDHCRCDMIVEPFWRMAKVAEIPSYFGMKIDEETTNKADSSNHIISHHYENQFETLDDIYKLKEPEIKLDEEETERRRSLLDGIFGDVLPVKVVGVTGGHFHPWDDLSRLCGVEDVLYKLYDDPELMHALMRRYTDLSLTLLRKEEELGLLETSGTTVHCTAALCDDIPYGPGATDRTHIWGRGMAQIFGSVSPAMHEEFDIVYQAEYFKHFPIVYYGCCEPLHNKMHIVEKIPNVRKVTVTPWADQKIAAENIGDKYVMARKPNPAIVATPELDADVARKDIRYTLELCRANGTPVEFTLKDISSVSYNPRNLEQWARIAMDEVTGF